MNSRAGGVGVSEMVKIYSCKVIMSNIRFPLSGDFALLWQDWASFAPVTTNPWSKGQSVMRRDDDRIIPWLEDEQPDYEAQHSNEDTRKKCRPESRDLESGHDGWDQKHHQGIDHQQKESESDDGQRDSQQDDEWPDNRIGQSQQQCSGSQRSFAGKRDAVEYETGHP